MWTNQTQIFHLHSDIRASLPNVCLPEVLDDATLAALGFTPVAAGTAPAFNTATQKLVEVAPAQVGGVWTRQWEAQDLSREELKAKRTAAVEAITVTTAAGHVYQGDETSQGRMVRAIVALQATGTPTVTWVLADNTVIQASAAELTEALALAGAAQAAIWVI